LRPLEHKKIPPIDQNANNSQSDSERNDVASSDSTNSYQVLKPTIEKDDFSDLKKDVESMKEKLNEPHSVGLINSDDLLTKAIDDLSYGDKSLSHGKSSAIINRGNLRSNLLFFIGLQVVLSL